MSDRTMLITLFLFYVGIALAMLPWIYDLTHRIRWRDVGDVFLWPVYLAAILYAAIRGRGPFSFGYEVSKAWCFITGHEWYRPPGAGYYYCENCGKYRKDAWIQK